MSENLFVSHSAPTLAGIKTGNLFNVEFTDAKMIRDEIRKLNIVLVAKGIRVIPFREKNNRFLIYVYRPTRLREDFKNKQLLKILKSLGYPVSDPDRCIAHLIKRLKGNDDFPHEIGLFLGYPPEDVKGFIDNKAQNYKAVGTWKVYGDEVEAEKRFMSFKQCTIDYCSKIERGVALENLVVSL